MIIKPKAAKLYELVTPQIARDIVSKRLPAGSTILSEPQLVAAFGVSKTVARETVQTLESVGLVRVQHGRRTVVLDEQEWDILSRTVQEAYRAEDLGRGLIAELYEVRLQSQPKAACWAAERARPDEAKQIREILEAMRQSLNTPRVFLDHDHAFHVAVVRAASNRVLRAVLRDIRELLITSWNMSVLSSGDVRTVFAQHQRISEAISSADGAQAEQAMREHLKWAVAKDSPVIWKLASGET